MKDTIQHNRNMVFYSSLGRQLSKDTDVSKSVPSPHAEIKKICDIYTHTGRTPFTLVRRLVTEVVAVIGDSRLFIEAQYRLNPKTEVVRFLKDTVNYINLGYREMNVAIWAELIDRDKGGFTNRDSITFDDVYIPTTEEMVKKWLSSDEHIRDFFITMNILFGDLE